jgi:methylglutaconyl-CoA hydratase
MNYRFLKVERKGAVAYVSLNRAEVRNAFNREVVAELTEWSTRVRSEPGVRTAVLSGEGKVFCAGADIEWLSATMNFTAAQYAEDARALHVMLSSLDTLPFPLIARIHGAAIAGGVGLTSVCDIAIAAEDTIFAITEIKIGIVPAVISPFVLAKIDASAARCTFLTGGRFSARRALEIGLVHEVVSAADLDDGVDRYVGEILTAGPEAVAVAKSLIRTVAGLKPEDAAPITAAIIAERRASAEGQAGMRAFLNKQPPPWIA